MYILTRTYIKFINFSLSLRFHHSFSPVTYIRDPRNPESTMGLHKYHRQNFIIIRCMWRLRAAQRWCAHLKLHERSNIQNISIYENRATAKERSNNSSDVAFVYSKIWYRSGKPNNGDINRFGYDSSTYYITIYRHDLKTFGNVHASCWNGHRISRYIW